MRHFCLLNLPRPPTPGLKSTQVKAGGGFSADVTHSPGSRIGLNGEHEFNDKSGVHLFTALKFPNLPTAGKSSKKHLELKGS